MESPIFSIGTKPKLIAKLFSKHFKNASQLGVREIVIPCVDSSSLNNKEKYNV